MVLGSSTQYHLTHTYNSVLGFTINSGKIKQAENKLNAFLNKVNAQDGKAIIPEDTGIIRLSVEFIRNTL